MVASPAPAQRHAAAGVVTDQTVERGVGRHAPQPGALGAAEVVSAAAMRTADRSERLRQMVPEMVESLVGSGLLRAFVPAAYGGPELHPVVFARAVEAIATADGATGWCTMIGGTTSSLAWFLHPDAAAEVFADPTSTAAGVFAPLGHGVVGRDTVTVTGRWPWGSGTRHSDWILGGVICDDAIFRLCMFARDDVTFHDTWHTLGLAGSGSGDFSVSGATVPLARTVQPGAFHPYVDGALGRFPNLSLLASGVAAAALGIADRAIDEITALAGVKVAQHASTTLANNASAQIGVARSIAGVRAARAGLYDTLDDAWATIERGDRVTEAQRVAIRLAAAFAGEQAVAAVDAAFTIAGGTSIFDGHALQRCFRDVHVAAQHIQVAPKNFQTTGRYLMGIPTDTSQM